MATASITTALETLTTPTPLSIHALAEPVLSSTTNPNNTASPTTRSSPTSSSAAASQLQSQSLTPTSLAADLAHHKSLFSKLRFSYTTQVTKEKFLKSIIADPPAPISSTQISNLEPVLASSKAALKAKKVRVADTLEELGSQARDVARRSKDVDARTRELANLPPELEALESRLEKAQRNQPVLHADPDLNLPLVATQTLLTERLSALEAVDAQIEEMRAAVERRRIEVGDLGAEVEGLEKRKRGVVEEAREMAKRRRQGKGGAEGIDAIEMSARWARGSEKVLRGLLEV